jgi:hypothetical protein
LDNKKKICARALAGDWVLGFSHDPHRFFGKIGKTGREYKFKELMSERGGTRGIREERNRGRTG